MVLKSGISRPVSLDQADEFLLRTKLKTSPGRGLLRGSRLSQIFGRLRLF